MNLRILLVEDVPQTRDDVCGYLSRRLPHATIDAVEAVDQAIELIEKNDYDVAILDFRLPATQGTAAMENDRSLCRAVRARSSGTFILHFSSYLTESDIQAHLREVHPEDGPDHVSPWFDKKDLKYPQKLLNAILSFYEGGRIASRMDDSFGISVRGHRYRLRRNESRRAVSFTNELAELFRDIIEYWDVLDPELQTQIRKNFVLDNPDKPTRVSLI